ncbi:MAG: glycoside hydrolase family 2 protein [Erysipelotrichaceae bacterium]|nr:glycoside hydrolase family 2 protein [Erysipelotrichaceae bacterium]
MISLNNNWTFNENWQDDFRYGVTGEPVRLPHTCRMLNYHYINEKDYQMICGYSTVIEMPDNLEHKKVFLQFDGAGHIATVYVDGVKRGVHKGGYTAFRVDITSLVRPAGKHVVSVCLDTTENPEIPPFGYVIDYLTYGGLYREAWLDIVDEEYVSDVFVYTPELNRAVIQIESESSATRIVRIKTMENEIIREAKTPDNNLEVTLKNVKPWELDDPVLYKCEVSLENHEGSREVTFGFRTVTFDNNDFYLNGRKVFLRGLNRHQNYPYIGYAATASLQYEDARILKEELGCNAVRTSHYPQSQHFIDACDRLGLLVFTEIPGWQHIGDQKWKKHAIKNVREMIIQYRNHPSIFLWGVRINESQDDDILYTVTNKVAHQLDPSRCTSGVRYLQNSSLLEDVYAYNDFSHNGLTPGARAKKRVTKHDRPLIITEANGHMFPTKAFDNWEKRQAHAIRHATVLNQAMADGDHAGCFQWCMFDYPTHKDFGSGDRICYHGVMDGFRNPKLAAALYASQQDQTPVLEVGSSMDIGDYPGGFIGNVYVFSNMDTVKLYKNDVYVADLGLTDLTSLPHPVMIVNDTIGKLLETNEGFTGKKEQLFHDGLLSAARNGFDKMPVSDKLKIGYGMVRYGMKYSDAVQLYGKYVGNWGGESTIWRFDGIKDGKTVISRTLAQSCRLHLDVTVSRTHLAEKDTYDMAMVRVRVLDEYCNPAPYYQLPVSFNASGTVEVRGLSNAALEGGCSGCYVATTGLEGKGTLQIRAEGLDPVNVEFETEVIK